MKHSIRYIISHFLRKLGIGFDARKHPSVKKMWQHINSLEDSTIIFKFIVESNGDWSAISTNVDGLMTGGRKTDGIIDLIEDAIFTYYEVPPEYCDARVFDRNYMFANKEVKNTPVFNFSSAKVVAA